MGKKPGRRSTWQIPVISEQVRTRIFQASGGSFSVAAYAELLSVGKCIMIHAMILFLYMVTGLDKIPSKIECKIVGTLLVEYKAKKHSQT